MPSIHQRHGWTTYDSNTALALRVSHGKKGRKFIGSMIACISSRYLVESTMEHSPQSLHIFFTGGNFIIPELVFLVLIANASPSASTWTPTCQHQNVVATVFCISSQQLTNRDVKQSSSFGTLNDMFEFEFGILILSFGICYEVNRSTWKALLCNCINDRDASAWSVCSVPVYLPVVWSSICHAIDIDVGYVTWKLADKNCSCVMCIRLKVFVHR